MSFMSVERPLSELIIRDLMFETLKDKDFCKVVTEYYTFYGGASEYDLYWIMELKAIDKGLIDEKRKVPISAWGSTRDQLIEYSTTNFCRDEINRIYESFYLLLNNGIVAPGMHRWSNNLPAFHITEHGKRCLEEKEILPYDIDGYINKINSINELDEWVKFYMLEALRCYNARCYNATTVMIGLSSERLVELLIDEVSRLLDRKSYSYSINNTWYYSSNLKVYFDDEISKKRNISQKYLLLIEIIDKIKDVQGIKEVKNISNSVIDTAARDTFVNYLRLNRNEVSHCSEIKKEPNETMMLFMTFVKYCTLITQLIKKIIGIV